MKIAIIGYKGRVAKRHIKAWEGLGIEWKGYDEGDKYDFGEFDIIDICTPIFAHIPLILQAVKAKVPILCEKPIARTLKEAHWVLNLRHKIGIIYQFRFNPKILKLKKEIEHGKYGEIKLVTSQYYRWRGEDYYKSWESSKELAGGGTVLNVTIHYLDLMQWIFGYPIEIKGFSNSMKNMEVEDTAVAIMKFPKGVIGSYVVTTHANPPKHYEFSVYGTKGYKTIQLRENEYHKENFKAFIKRKDYVTPEEAIKSLKMALEIIK